MHLNSYMMIKHSTLLLTWSDLLYDEGFFWISVNSNN